MKDFKGIVKAVGYDSPNKKFKDILGPVTNNNLLNKAANNNNSQQPNNLSGGGS